MDISSMLEVQVKEMKIETNIKENVTPRIQAPSTILEPIPVSRDEQSYYQMTFGHDIASVRYRRLHCTACDVHIGSAPSQAHNMLEHPVLRTLLCAKCHEFYGDGSFEQGDDATDMFCRWCANGGNLYCCSYCSNTFCYKCIRRNFVSLVRKKIEADEKWQCFVCNPTDLYDARAVCWALLRHIQTVTRILQNDKIMSQDEIEEKMDLDESECCPRRSKRRQKRKHESNSEEEDETYIPKINGVPVTINMKRKQYKKYKPRYSAQNGTKQVRTMYPTIAIKSRPSLSPSNQLKEPQSQSLRHEPGTNIEHREAAVESTEGIFISSPSTMNVIESPMPTRYETTTIPPSLYHTALLNQTSASTTYIRPAVMSPVPFQPIILPPQPVSQMQNSSQSSQSLRSTANAMVTISKPAKKCYKPQLIFPKVRNSDITLTPNIIELDSDSDDELKIVEQRNDPPNDNSATNVDMDISDKVIPVALFSTENDNIKENQLLREMSSSLKRPPSSFSEIMSTHCREIDTFLGNVKNIMRDFFVLPDNETGTNMELVAKRQIKRFHKNMRETIFNLARINDRVIREYDKWERKTKSKTSSTNQSTVTPRKDIDIPLNMTCVNESDTDSDYEESEYHVMEPSDRIKSSNILEDLLIFKKDVKHCGVGDSALLSKDKMVQVYDVVSRDYEQCIGYSLLTKAHYNDKTHENVLEPMKISNENFDKYQEQFIFYLQHIEDHGIKTEDMKGLENPNESMEEFAEPDSPCTSEFRQNIDLLIASTEQSIDCDQDKSSKNFVNSVTYDNVNVPANATDYNKITQIDNDSISSSKTQVTDVRLTEKFHKIELPRVQNGAATLNNDDISLNKNTSDVERTETAMRRIDEDCTIIDD